MTATVYMYMYSTDQLLGIRLSRAKRKRARSAANVNECDAHWQRVQFHVWVVDARARTQT